jgi:hypothetical protein
MSSAWHSRARFTSPGASRITWVVCATPSSPWARSAKEMMMAVGLDQTSAESPSRCAAPEIAISSRGAEVPY